MSQSNIAIASDEDILTVGRWLTGKNISYQTAKNAVSIVGIFILNNAKPRSQYSHNPSRDLTTSQIGECLNDRIPLHTIRRILLMLVKNKFAEREYYQQQLFSMPFYCLGNELGYEFECPIHPADIGVPLNTFLNVFAELMDDIKNRGLCNESK